MNTMLLCKCDSTGLTLRSNWMRQVQLTVPPLTYVCSSGHRIFQFDLDLVRYSVKHLWKPVWLKGIQRPAPRANLKGKEKENKCDIPTSPESLHYKGNGWKCANSTFSRVRWGKEFSFMKTHSCYRTEMVKTLGEQGSSKPKRGAITGTHRAMLP